MKTSNPTRDHAYTWSLFIPQRPHPLKAHEPNTTSLISKPRRLHQVWLHCPPHCSGQLVDVSPLSLLTSLNALNLDCSDVENGRQLANVAPLSVLVALETLHLVGCVKLTDVSPMSTLTSLKSLDLSWCDLLSDVAALSFLTSLTSLNLSWCDQLSDVAALSPHLFNKFELVLRPAKRCFTSIEPHLLGQLVLSCCQGSNISPLSSLISLTSLNLCGSGQLSDVAPLSFLTSLTNLSLGGCSQLRDVSPLLALTSLTILDLWRCDQLSDVSSLSYLLE